MKLLNKSQEDILATLRLFEDSKNYDDQTIHTYITSKIVKEAYKSNRSIIDITQEMTDLTKQQIIKLLDPKKLI